MSRTVEDVMTRAVVAVTADAPFKRVVELLDEHHISALPVLDADGRLDGIVTEGDLLLKEGFSDEDSHLFEGKRRRVVRRKAAGLLAGELMTKPVVTIRPDATLREAARLMHDHRVKRLPVVTQDDHVVGIVSRADLLRVFLRPDTEIERDVVGDVLQRKLTMEPGVVRVTVRRGVVTLCGEVERRSLITALTELVHEVDGVVGVVNKLTFRFDDTATLSPSESAWGSVPTKLIPN